MADRKELLSKIEDTVPYRKSRKGKKPFVVECLYAGRRLWPWHDGKWRVWGRYKTEKARDTALATLQRKNSYLRYEYRAG